VLILQTGMITRVIALRLPAKTIFLVGGAILVMRIQLLRSLLKTETAMVPEHAIRLQKPASAMVLLRQVVAAPAVK
jgi:hypothetical protein